MNFLGPEKIHGAMQFNYFFFFPEMSSGGEDVVGGQAEAVSPCSYLKVNLRMSAFLDHKRTRLDHMSQTSLLSTFRSSTGCYNTSLSGQSGYASLQLQ